MLPARNKACSLLGCPFDRCVCSVGTFLPVQIAHSQWPASTPSRVCVCVCPVTDVVKTDGVILKVREFQVAAVKKDRLCYLPLEFNVGVNRDSHVSLEFPIDPAKPHVDINQLNKQLDVLRKPGIRNGMNSSYR
jgi:hypothetical protein